MNGVPADPPAHATLNEALRAATVAPGGITFIDLQEREQTLEFAEIYRRALRVSGALTALGVRPGDRVGLVLPTSPAFLDAFFGALLAGATPVPLAPPQRLGRLDEFHAATARMLTKAGARIVLTDERVRRLLGVAVERARPELGCHDVERLDGPPLARDVAPGDLAVIQYSSGSTVDPKPVALTHENLMWQLAAIAQLTPGRPDTPFVGVSWLPLHHDMGLIGVLLSAIYRPLPVALIPPELFLARPALWLRAISRHRATISPAPSFAYSLCVKRIKDAELEGVDLSRWRYALNGAEPVAVGVLADFAARFARQGFDANALMPVYGMAEASLAVTFSPSGRPPRALAVSPLRLAKEGVAALAGAGARHIASVGVPVPGVSVEVRDDDGRALGERRVGRIWVRGRSVMPGYFNDLAASARALVGGWLDTGDLGFVADGELYICGRAKDVIIIRGANHAPQEFEECLDRVAGVRTGCAVALGFIPETAEGGGSGEEELLVLLESAEPDAGLGNRARSAILERTGIRAHTVMVLAPGTLPRTTSGKLRRAEALRRFSAGELTAPAPVSPLRMARAMARSTLAFARMRLVGWRGLERAR
jgi:acyl-CoA synthetase (AMP-forming)/AMP-acid ligase II